MTVAGLAAEDETVIATATAMTGAGQVTALSPVAGTEVATATETETGVKVGDAETASKLG